MISGRMSIRAILPDQQKIWYAADDGRFGFYDFSNNTTYEKRIVFDSLKLDFRSIADNAKSIFIINAGSPALLYKMDKLTLKPKLVYRETHKKAFYDSMKFWNEEEGIAFGDPIEDCFSILITRDGGDSWTKLSCSDLPKIVDGETAFAASNTNIVIKDNHCWIVSGGKKARVFYSADKGQTWEVFETPITQGGKMTGIFTADFYDAQTGIIAGGNYESQKVNLGNKAMSKDGGKQWELVADGSGFGYASCIQFVPGSDGMEIVSVGNSGLSYSSDGGLTWKRLLKDTTLYTIRFLNEKTAFAAGKNKIIRIRFKK